MADHFMRYSLATEAMDPGGHVAVQISSGEQDLKIVYQPPALLFSPLIGLFISLNHDLLHPGRSFYEIFACNRSHGTWRSCCFANLIWGARSEDNLSTSSSAALHAHSAVYQSES